MRLYFKASAFLLAIVVNGFMAPVHAIKADAHPRLEKIVNDLVSSGLYSRPEIEAILAQAEIRQNVLDAMTSPAEYKLTWGKYRKIFIQDDRIQQGVDFWLKHQDALQRAEAEYGVPASMIVAIVGVESKYGKYKGSHKVIDSLVTLVVGFERRSEFFASELKEFLILSKENQLDATAILGSYAGAVGFPQFISSSYRNYAVDFNEDGRTDLIDQEVDAIGSIANYFVKNGWHKGQPVTSKAHVTVPAEVAELVSRKRKVQHSAVTLRGLGAEISASIPDQEKLGVLSLNTNDIVPNNDKSTYIVRAGDTACQIAEAHGMKCKELFRLNKLNTNGDIFRGQKLKVRDSNSKAYVSGIESEAEDREILRYFFTHHNFYVITRYNQSVLYAMAVNDLSEAIQAVYKDSLMQGGQP